MSRIIDESSKFVKSSNPDLNKSARGLGGSPGVLDLRTAGRVGGSD